MANEILSTIKANLPSPAKESGQVIKLEVVKVPDAIGQALPEEGKVLPQQSVSSTDLREAVSEINDFVQNVQRDLSFSLDEGSGHTIIRVIDTKSGELIRQIPSEEVLAIASQLRDVKDVAVTSNSLPQGLLFSDST